MPPHDVPRVFDRALGRARLARAVRKGAADFLLRRAADDLIERLALVQRPFPDVLDLGTPGPVLAQALARPGRSVTQAAPITQALGAGVGLVADAEHAPFAPGSFDLIVSALALQSVNDLPGALAQIRRMLRPDGLFLACMLGGRTLSELRAALTAAEIEISGGASPRVAPFADVRDMGGLLQRAGFALPVADGETVTVRYDSMIGLLADLRAMGATNALVERARDPMRRPVLARAAALYQENAQADGRVPATFEFVWLSGWAPHESQQKPLAPGSAKMSLADALAAQRKP